MPNDGIVGINAMLEVSTGYDVNEPTAHPGEASDFEDPRMSKAERLLLADRMIDLWTRYRAAVA